MKTKIQIVKCIFAFNEKEKHYVLYPFVVLENKKPLFVINAKNGGKIIRMESISSISYQVDNIQITIRK